MKRILLIFCPLLLGVLTEIEAQPCGLNDTLLISPDASPVFNYEVFNIFNDDLSNPDQGICGVEIDFLHQFVDNLELVLTSPTGQSVTLTGPNNDEQFSFTTSARWRITFVPCGAVAMPDDGYLPQWNNNQPNNYVVGGQYSGTYYPFLGCLEDFDTGTVNGTWTITAGNDPSPYFGAILGFRLLFCDDRGLDCCFAAAGELTTETDILTCVGDSSLILPAEPIFNGTPLDSSEYGYTFVIGEDGTVIDYDSLPDLRTFPPGNYQVCGLSYQREDYDSFPLPGGLLMLDELRDSLNGLEPPFCGEMTDTCVQVTILPQPIAASITATICEGDSLAVADTVIYDMGMYTVVLPSYAGCDSTVSIDLSVVANKQVTLEQIICEGDSFAVGDSTYTTMGTYIDTLQTSTGCDSIVTLNLTVLEPAIEDISVVICAGDVFMAGDSMLTEAGLYGIPFTAASGCDSLLRVDLMVLDLTPSITPPDTLTCLQSTVLLDGGGSTGNAPLSYQWRNSAGQPLGMASTQTVSAPGWYFLEISGTLGATSCARTDSVLVIADIDSPQADAGPPDALNCDDTSLTVGGSNTSTGSNFSYTWSSSTSDGFVGATNQANVPINAPATYQLIVTNTVNNCSDTSEVMITIDTLSPVADAGMDTTLTCIRTSVMLDGTASSQGPNITYAWSSAGTPLPSDPDSPTPTINETGDYQLIVEDTDNGCTDTATVQVGIDTLAPSVNILPPAVLNCATTSLELDATSSDSGPDFSFLWDTGGGNFASGDDTLLPTVDAPGSYTLSLTNDINGCTSDQSVTVADTINQINVAIQTAGPISCAQPQVTLDSLDTSSGTNVQYAWTTIDGTLPTDTSSLPITIETAGTYTLTVIDTFTQCDASASITIGTDTVAPLADAGLGFQINCTLLQDTLTAQASSQGTEFTYAWDGPCVASILDEQQIIADCPGTYYLTVTDTSNGCSNIDSTVVAQDGNIPVADAGENNLLTCDSITLILDGGNSSQGPSFVYAWVGPQVLSGGNSLYPEIGQPGAYTLTVTDTLNTCQATATINVAQDTLHPVADAGDVNLLTCDSLVVQIGGINTSTGADFSYAWSAITGGSFAGSTDEPTALINQSGEYELVVTNTINGCRDSSLTSVFENNTPTDIAIGPATTLDCGTPTTFIGDGDLPLGINFNYQWTGPCLLSVTDSTFAEVGCAGEYILSVFDSANGCSTADTLTVAQEDDLPSAILPDTVLLSCETGIATIDASASSGSFFTWLYNGLPSPLSGLMPTIDAPGTYSLIAENAEQDCADTASVEVVFDCAPMALIALADTLTCAVNTVILDGSASSSGPAILYEWLAPDGNCIIGGEGTDQLEVRCGGVYQLIVTNTLVGISSIASVEVVMDTVPPVAEAGPPVTLTCDNPTDILDASGSSQGDTISYAWTRLEDEFYLNDSIQITVNDDGVYFLEVTDHSNGCSDQDAVVVQLSADLPDITFSGTIIPCLDETFLLEAIVEPEGQPYEYTWTGDVILSGENTATVLLDTAGTVRVTVVNTANNCTVYRDITIIQQQCIPCLEIAPVDSFTCLVDTVAINASFCEPCEGCTVNWNTSEGSFLSATDSLSVLVGLPGDYTITATDTLGFSEIITVRVAADTLPPVVDAGVDQVLECDVPGVTLGTGTANPLLSYQWLALNGEPITDDTLPSITINFPDTFVIEATHLLTGCTATDTTIVALNTAPPIAEAGDTATINCETPSVLLDGSASSFGNNIAYSWSGPLGGIVTGQTAFNPTVDTAGWYALTVLDTLTGCSAVDSVLVTGDTVFPPLPALGDTALTCNAPVVFLLGEVPEGPEFSFCWYQLDDDGAITGPCVDILGVAIDQPGGFRFEVTNNENGCSDAIDLQVVEDFDPPIALAGPDTTLLCSSDSLLLSGSVLPDTIEASYEWTALEGNPIGGSTSPAPTIYEAGSYVLTATNLYNGCTALDTVVVALDDAAPQADAGPNTFLSCTQSEVRLLATAPSAGLNFNWTGPAGGIVVDGDTPTPLVGTAGAYILTVINPDNECEAVDTVLVLNDTLSPIANIMNTDLQLDCNQSTLLLDGSASTANSGSGLAYEWQAPPANLLGNDSTFLFEQAGDYLFIVEDEQNGCRDSVAFSISINAAAPIVDIAEPATITCSRDTVVLDATASSSGDTFAHFWVSPGGDTLQGLLLPVEQGGTFTLFVTDTTNGCTDSLAQSVQMDTLSPTVMIAPTAPLDCDTPTAQLDGSASSVGSNFAYQWMALSEGASLLSDADGITAEAGAAGWYGLGIIDTNNGCTGVDSTEVVALSELISGADIAGIPPSCVGRVDGQIVLNTVSGGTPPFVVSVDGGPFVTLDTFINLPPGDYTIDIEDSNGCTWQDSVLIPQPDTLSISLGNEVTLLLGESDTLVAKPSVSSYDSIWWWPTDGQVVLDDPLQYIVSPNITTVYSVWVSTGDGCVATAAQRIKVSQDYNIYAPTVFSPNGDDTNDFFYLFADQSVERMLAFRVFDRWGNLVHEAADFLPNDPTYGWDGTLDGQPMDTGVFTFYARVLLASGDEIIVEGDVLLLR